MNKYVVKVYELHRKCDGFVVYEYEVMAENEWYAEIEAIRLHGDDGYRIEVLPA